MGGVGVMDLVDEDEDVGAGVGAVGGVGVMDREGSINSRPNSSSHFSSSSQGFGTMQTAFRILRPKNCRTCVLDIG